MPILYKKKSSYQTGGKTVGNKGKDVGDNTVLSKGGFGKPTEVSMKDEKKENKLKKKKARILARKKKKADK